jgi:hypothetical protein
MIEQCLVYTRAVGKMNHSENSEPGSRGNHFVIGVSVLLLALAVFGWGLHSKLSLYHVRARASEATPIAKLLSQRERTADAAQHCHVDLADWHPTASPDNSILMPLPENGARAKESHEDTPPLASRTAIYKGPSLRRPPPSLVG